MDTPVVQVPLVPLEGQDECAKIKRTRYAEFVGTVHLGTTLMPSPASRVKLSFGEMLRRGWTILSAPMMKSARWISLIADFVSVAVYGNASKSECEKSTS